MDTDRVWIKKKKRKRKEKKTLRQNDTKNPIRTLGTEIHQEDGVGGFRDPNIDTR